MSIADGAKKMLYQRSPGSLMTMQTIIASTADGIKLKDLDDDNNSSLIKLIAHFGNTSNPSSYKVWALTTPTSTAPSLVTDG